MTITMKKMTIIMKKYIFENQYENSNEDIVLHTNENNASEYTTPESTTSAQNASKTETSTTSQFVITKCITN